MRTPVIAGNWKLFKTAGEAVELIDALKPAIAGANKVEIVVSPVFTALTSVAKAIKGSRIKLAAQNCYWEEEGAFTGEVSPKLLLDAGCSHVIIGHSERRQYFGETNATVNKRIKASVAAGLTAIFCIGETLAQREADKTFAIIRSQLKGGLKDLDSVALEKVIIAYEPVWAIGTGKTASDDQAQEVHSYIRSLLSKMYNDEVAERMRILYGGSVKPENVKGLMAKTDIDGALVGGASLKAESFAAIVNFGK